MVYAGSREDEVELKARGVPYKTILDQGGGIYKTVRETADASLGRIVSESLDRLQQLIRSGVTTVEVKSGYGLTGEGEVRLLKAIRKLAGKSDAELVPTFLGLHAAPKDSVTKEYVRRVVGEVLPLVAASPLRPAFTDCFCEAGVFSAGECTRFLRASKKLGILSKVHADEFSDSGGAVMAADEGCVSADHLGRSTGEGVEKMAQRGVTAVLLPGTSLCSGIPYADAAMISEAGCKVALGTDLSPNSWIESPYLVMSLACNALRMTPAQALLGFTRNAAAAIARRDIGMIRPGMRADFVIHPVAGHRSLPYRVGGSYSRRVFRAGREIFPRLS